MVECERLYKMLRSVVAENLPMIQMENVTTALQVFSQHGPTLAPMHPVFEFTTIEDVFNVTNEFYHNATNLYGNFSDDNVKHFDNHTLNQTIVDDKELLKRDHVFDRTDVRVIFITMYTLVFCFCFFGKCCVGVSGI